MKRARFTEEQIIGVLKEHEAGAKTADLARKHGVSEATLYNWKANQRRPHSALGYLTPVAYAANLSAAIV
jgi:transposase-like protein